jgi:hypothetical protein
MTLFCPEFSERGHHNPSVYFHLATVVCSPTLSTILATEAISGRTLKACISYSGSPKSVYRYNIGYPLYAEVAFVDEYCVTQLSSTGLASGLGVYH